MQKGETVKYSTTPAQRTEMTSKGKEDLLDECLQGNAHKLKETLIKRFIPWLKGRERGAVP